jgi:large-conductance mechanosensitive channel
MNHLKGTNHPVIDPYKNILAFTLTERFITITVIGSVFTFAFISSMKTDIVDPLLNFILPEENFGFMDITIRDGQSYPSPIPKRIDLKLGDFFKQFLTWLFSISILYLMAKYTRFPSTPGGNILGSAVL